MKTRFGGLPAARKKTDATATAATDNPTRGRPKSTAPDAVPVTLYLSDETYRQARAKLLLANDKRPYSRIIDLMTKGWLAGKIDPSDFE